MNKEIYGTSPLVAALPAIRAFNALRADERRRLAREYVERQMLVEEIERLLS